MGGRDSEMERRPESANGCIDVQKFRRVLQSKIMDYLKDEE